MTARHRITSIAAAMAIMASACSTTPNASSETDSTQADQSPSSESQEGEIGPSDSSAQSSRYELAATIHIDQFGYLPNDPKVAVLADPQIGFNADTAYEPGPTIEVRNWETDEVVLAVEPAVWNNGQVHAQSGDRGWTADFSDVTTAGTYYLVDPINEISTGPFQIGTDVYDEVLVAAQRMFWHNRINVDHPAEFSGEWTDTAALIGTNQDTEARFIDDPNNDALRRDLSGGWADAGDNNKYVTFASEAVHNLLSAYETAPSVFGDDIGIPESGNGAPDLLDEIAFELRWLQRMQEPSGAVLTKVGMTAHGHPHPPSSDTQARYYEEVCSSSTIALASMFAHAAVVLGPVPQHQALADELQAQAIDAWRWYQTNPRRDDCDPQVVLAGNADRSLEDQTAEAVVAAVYLYELTGDAEYRDAVGSGLASTRPFRDYDFGRYSPHHADALLRYRTLDRADPATVEAIEARFAEVTQGGEYGFDPNASLYRSSMPDGQYHWGSNRVLASTGVMNLLGDVDGGRERALAHLHTFHGVNPLGLVYLTNTESIGAERSAQTLFHFWFGAGSDYDTTAGSSIGVPPGFVIGGPNASYSGSLTPPANQPAMKSYLDDNWEDGEPMWELSEPAIYYQAGYIRLLASLLSE